MKILYVTTISLTMNSFFKPHIQMLVNEGHRVDIACNYNDLELDDLYTSLGCGKYQVDFSRTPFSKDNVKAFKQLKTIIEKGNYDVVHCHTPNASVITRLVCYKERKKTGLKVFYTAHGFHFYKGAPFVNWLIYYPIEKLCSCFTDKLITINNEDFNLAKRTMKSKEIYQIPGVGIDISRFENIEIDRRKKRTEIGIPENALLLLSVGELNKNKNHEVIIKAIAKLRNEDVFYVVAGEGDTKKELLELVHELGLADKIHFLGFRYDIPELNHCADAFCFPSYREGLGLAAIEAMICGLPLITSNVHGINDYSIVDVTGLKCEPDDVEGFATAISQVLSGNLKYDAMKSKEIAMKYSIKDVLEKIKALY